MDLLISFDDTGSMYSIRRQVRTKINQLIDEVFAMVPDLKIGIIIHNDYCDHDLVQNMDFTADKDAIKKFVNRSSSNGGGDGREAYAYVLNQMKTFSWRSGSRAAILIGDAPPHEKGDVSAGHREKFDWKDEVSDLSDMGVSVYPIQALNHQVSKYFYQGIAALAKTVRLELAQFHHITQYITAIVHKSAGTLDEYANSKAEFSNNISLRNMFSKLLGRHMDSEFDSKRDSLGKFQVCEVSSKQRIKDFVDDMGVHYKAGRGFYEWTKLETVQKRKEILFVNKDTGETLDDTRECREQLGIPLGTEGKINPKNFPAITGKYDVFIQSTSYTRNLVPDTKFLYEIDAH